MLLELVDSEVYPIVFGNPNLGKGKGRRGKKECLLKTVEKAFTLYRMRCHKARKLQGGFAFNPTRIAEVASLIHIFNLEGQLAPTSYPDSVGVHAPPGPSFYVLIESTASHI